MSLLLEARKKAQSTEALRTTSDDGLQLENSSPDADIQARESRQNARVAGQNLFKAKASTTEHSRPHPYLIYALGATILLLAVGAGYWWYLDSVADSTPHRPIAPVALQSIPAVGATAEPPDTESANDDPVAQEIAPEPVPETKAEPRTQFERAPATQAALKPPVRIEPQVMEAVDPLLSGAYSAYRNGNPDEARKLYRAMLAKDERNTDALLGMAALAQQRGDGLAAAQYYSRVLALDPRNAVANAGMSALNAEDNGNESRLKTLLREQNNSVALHFALGNLYAGQSRWSEAQQSYFNAWTLESDNAEFAYNLAVSLDHLGQGDQATNYYLRAQQLDPRHNAGFDHAQIARRLEELRRGK